jgi:hypothetical protein
MIGRRLLQNYRLRGRSEQNRTVAPQERSATRSHRLMHDSKNARDRTGSGRVLAPNLFPVRPHLLAPAICSASRVLVVVHPLFFLQTTTERHNVLALAFGVLS